MQHVGNILLPQGSVVLLMFVGRLARNHDILAEKDPFNLEYPKNPNIGTSSASF